VHASLNESLMDTAAKALIGEHDFTAFRAAGCQAKHANREIKSLNVYRLDDRVVVEVSANAFLHNMIRIIVGSLLCVGRGDKPPEWVGEILRQKDRKLGGVTAVPDGLYFLGPTYPAHFAIPDFATHWR
jgi:tRNA pseudouridine38-40 synthase